MVSIFSWSQLSIRLKVFSHKKHQSNFIFPLNWKNKRPSWYYSFESVIPYLEHETCFHIWIPMLSLCSKKHFILRKKFQESKIKKTKQGRIKKKKTHTQYQRRGTKSTSFVIYVQWDNQYYSTPTDLKFENVPMHRGRIELMLWIYVGPIR